MTNSDTANTVAAATQEAAQSLEEKLSCFKQAAAKRYLDMEQAASECVAKRPGTSIAIVALAGITLGLLLGKGRSR